MNWQEVSGNWVLLPARPVALIHFLGGAFVATAPQVTYRRLLEFLARQGYVVIATPFVNTFDHKAIASSVYHSFDDTLEQLHTRFRLKRFLPVYGMGHSMGCKLHLLIGSLFSVQRAGNVLISFNNYSARQAIPLFEQALPFFESFTLPSQLEFIPTPAETNHLVQQHYQVRRNLLVQFSQDDIDQTSLLAGILEKRFPAMTAIQKLKGSHLTPLGQDLTWQMGSAFTPLDAVGQWVRQEVYRELAQLERVVLQWLDPLASFE